MSSSENNLTHLPHETAVSKLQTAALKLDDGNRIVSSTRSLVEVFSLSNIVKEMRLKGKTYREIADHINSSNIIPNGYKVSYIAIARWCKNHNLAGDVSEYSGEEAVNVYLQETKALNLINGAIDLISVQMDDFNNQLGRNNSASVRDIKNLVDSLDKLTLRQQTLCANIATFQERIYKYETVSRVVGRIMAKISTLVSEEDYEDIKKDLAADPILREAIREIKPSGF